MPLPRPPAAVALAVLALAACSKQEHPKDLRWTGETLDERARPFRETSALGSAAPVPEQLDEQRQETAWLGVRHDLMLAPTVRKETCSCLAVAAGPAKSSSFFWTSGAPDIGPDAQAVAISARVDTCPGGPADEAARRPSISAVDQVNDDVILEVEDLPLGRPLASGAIIPRPKNRGSIYIRPRGAKNPYGKSPAGGLCKVR